MSSRPVRSTRAPQPKYTSGDAAGIAPVRSSSRTRAAVDSESEEEEGEQQQQQAQTVQLAHATTLEMNERQLIQHTNDILQWQEEGQEEEARMSDDEEDSTELNTSSLPALLSCLPSSLVRSLYSVELYELATESPARTIDNLLQSTDADRHLDQMIAAVRSWARREEGKQQRQGKGKEGREVEEEEEEEEEHKASSSSDFWSLLHSHHIPPRHLVTFCFLLLSSPRGVRRITQFRASALYLALLELAARSKTSLPAVLQEVVLRKVQTHVRAWARQDARTKEAGIQKKKSRGQRAAASTSADPFGDHSSSAGGADAQEEAEQSLWMSSAEAQAFIVDYLHQCKRLLGVGGIALGKYVDLQSHLMDTLMDLTRTEVEVGVGAASRRGAARSTVDVSSTIPHAAFCVLLELLQPQHGGVTHLFQQLLKQLLMSMLLSFGGGSATTPTVAKHLLPIHRSAVTFLKRLVTHVSMPRTLEGEVGGVAAPLVDPSVVHTSLHHFMQHLLLRASDRAEYRKLVTNVIVKELLADSPPKEQQGAMMMTPYALARLRSDHVSFVWRMSRNKRPAVRITALEVAEAAMQASWSMEPYVPPPPSPAPAKKPRVSISSFAAKMQQAAEEEEEEKKGEEEEEGRSKGRPSLQPGSTSLDWSASLLLEDDISFAGARPGPGAGGIQQFPLAKHLLSLLLGRCSDASPTVRAKALASLAHVLAFCADKYTASADEDPSDLTPEQLKHRESFRVLMTQRLAGSGGATLEESMARSVANTPAPASAGARATPASVAQLQRTASMPIASPAASNRNNLPTSSPLHPANKSFTFLHTPLQATSDPSRRRSLAPGTGVAAGLEGEFQPMPGTTTPTGADASTTLSGSFLPSLGLSLLPAFHPSNLGVRDVLAVLYKRSSDDKTLVRRAAIQALECILVAAAEEDKKKVKEEEEWAAEENGMDVSAATAASSSAPALLSCLTASDLQIFYDGCADKSLSIRKQALQSLTALLRPYADSLWPSSELASASSSALHNLHRIWLGAVLPLVSDREKSVVDQCVLAVEDIILRPLGAALMARHGPSKKVKADAGKVEALETRVAAASVWRLLGAMDGEMQHYFQRVLLQLLKGGGGSSSNSPLNVDLIKHLLKEIEWHCSMTDNDLTPVVAASWSDRTRAAWLFLEVLTLPSSLSALSGGSVDLLTPLHTVWEQVTGPAAVKLEESSLVRMLACMGNIANAGKWKGEQVVEYAAYLFQALLLQMQLPIQVTSKQGSSSGALASPELIKKQVWLLNCLCAALSKEAGGNGAKGKGTVQRPEWEGELLNTCEKQLEAFVQTANNISQASLKQLSQSSPATPLSSPSASSSFSSASTPTLPSSSLWNESCLITVLFTLGEVVLQHQAFHAKSTLQQGLITLVQMFLAPTMQLQGAGVKKEDKKQGVGAVVGSTPTLTLSPSVRAHAFLTLGKFCLRHEQLAKRCITLLISELDVSSTRSSPAVQNNVLLVLCDLCRAYTSIVEPYLTHITAMLAHPNTLIRKHTIMVLNVLLQEEYLKMRSTTHATSASGEGDQGEDADEKGVAVVHSTQSGSSSMFYRYLRCLVDEDASIRQLVEVSLNAILSKGGSSAGGATGGTAAAAATNVHGTRMHLHFVELIFFLNQCHEHPIYNQFGARSRTGAKGGKDAASAHQVADAAFSLVGPLGSPQAHKRFTLYKYALGTMSSEQKFILQSKLHTEVLQAVNEDSLLTSPWHVGVRIQDVIQDALLILASEFMQMGGGGGAKATKGKDGEGVEAVEAELQELALAAEEAQGGEGLVGGANAAGKIASQHAQSLAKAKLLHKLLKKSTMESCLPILFELRTVLARVHSPLTQWLNHYFAQLHLSYRSEMEEVLAGNPLLQKEIAYDLRRWQQEEAEAANVARWAKLDFPMVMQPRGLVRTSSAPIRPSASPMGRGVTSARKQTGGDNVARRLSMGGAAVQSTPLKTSSLSSLRMSATTPTAVASTPLRRTLSTPSGAAAAAVAAALATPPTSLRTPGASGSITTPVLRRSASMGTPASARARHMQLSAAKRTPSGLARTVEEGDEEDGMSEPGRARSLSLLSDADTDEEEEGAGAARRLIVMPPIEVATSAHTGAPGSAVKKWKVTLPGETAEGEEQEEEEESAAPAQPPTPKRQKSKRSQRTPTQTSPNEVQKKKRKQQQQSQQTTEEEDAALMPPPASIPPSSSSARRYPARRRSSVAHSN